MDLVLDVVRALAKHYPPWIQAELESGLPSIELEATRLALEVVQAERDAVPFAVAVRRIDFPLMGRVHFGLEDLLQHRLPPEFRAVVANLAAATKRGEFDEWRRSLFLAAARRDIQGALFRFILHEANNLDLLVATWTQPEFEVLGTLSKLEHDGETILKDQLASVPMQADDVRPLHVLFAELFLRALADAQDVARVVGEQEDAMAAVLKLIDATNAARALDAPNAALLRRDALEEDIGAQELVDRYPWHFNSVDAVYQRRSRLCRDFADGEPPFVTDGSRLIDLILEHAQEDGVTK